ncbi:uncharacterized protein EAE97_010774 [Botrytis byssoidea]|uniref:Cytoplasmic tRNA 2-thiolation protein 2 n=1 Tax=Botrytis byssoidea TaxID=139641 RepID=A0A9P5HVI0_9HELO|nr:uncharacterized protein EAE97_010774 [Botrytis byssoidea]KAF7924162.1 hypothetical protein EAE97_010774 [Botrytis byssoidea]
MAMATANPEAVHPSAEQPNVLCKRCMESNATLQIRSESVCQKCFSQYVKTKAVKRMETYKGKRSSKVPQKLLLPLSFGPSSSCLLHILDGHLQTQQERMNRVSYELFVVHIDLYLDDADREASAVLLQKYKDQYPRHSYSSYGLQEALQLEGIDWASLGISDAPTQGAEASSLDLQNIVSTMSSATSRADIVSTLLNRLLVDVAKRNDCESILFGDTTTRLAEKTLTETAKGRGFSLPWQVSDGPSPYGMGFNYPLRDILKKEIMTFSSSTTPLPELVVYQEPPSHISASSKSTTIDDLMAQYFESVEENFPSIVANVVRTSSKLKPSTDHVSKGCGICGLPVAEGTDGIYGWGGDQNPDSRPARENISSSTVLCYGCSRSING